MRIAITGATGLLGRNLLFEILKHNLTNLDNLEILFFGRKTKTSSLEDRIKDIIDNDGNQYIGINENTNPNLKTAIYKSIYPIEFDLINSNLGISSTHINHLKNNKIDYFFHLASLSDFRMDQHIINKLKAINIDGTNNILNLITELQVSEIIYTGSAYSCGIDKTESNPSEILLNAKFRNYYEESKLIGESIIKEFAIKNKLRYRIFRPVGICGRLIEKPIGCTNKYDLFYAWAAFFLREKLKHYKTLENIYDKPFNMPIRIAFNKNAGLNIVPADYTAKIIHNACINNDPNISYHIASKNDISHDFYLPLILRELNIIGVEFVDNEPNNKKNAFEMLYYKSIGKIYTPYLLMGHCNFNIDNLIEINKSSVPYLEINKSNFMDLIRFAKERFFGLSYVKI